MPLKCALLAPLALLLPLGPSYFLLNNNFVKTISKRSTQDDSEDLEIEFQKIGEEAEKAFEKMDDYSFKIFLPCSKFGTGWILDYEIPKEGGYPTKWYIATNAHVANHFRFVENPYGQALPESMIGKSSRVLIDTAELWKSRLSSKELCDAHGNSGYFDFNLSRQESGARLKSNYGAIAKGEMKEPKLFYAPVDFLKKDLTKGIKDHNYKDFAVIEVEFTNEKYARSVTGDFYEKYRASKKLPIDFFSVTDNRIKKFSSKNDAQKRLYSLAYPYRNDSMFKYTAGYNEDLAQTSEFANNVYGLSDSEARVNATEIDNRYTSQMTDWYGEKLNRVGHFYLLNNFSMGGGASGGLVIDGNGDLLGIRSMGDSKGDRSLVVPLRSNEVVTESLRTPAYDLIEGGFNGQLTSYRLQVQKYILNKGKETWLSQRGDWKYAPERNNYSIIRFDELQNESNSYTY